MWTTNGPISNMTRQLLNKNRYSRRATSLVVTKLPVRTFGKVYPVTVNDVYSICIDLEKKNSKGGNAGIEFVASREVITTV